MADIKTWTVLSNKKNVKKILEKITVEELQDAFKPNGVALKLDEELDGPFIGFYSIKSQESVYMTPLEFVEAVKGDLWGAQRDYKKVLAEKQAKEEEKKRRRLQNQQREEQQNTKKKKKGGRVVG